MLVVATSWSGMAEGEDLTVQTQPPTLGPDRPGEAEDPSQAQARNTSGNSVVSLAGKRRVVLALSDDKDSLLPAERQIGIPGAVPSLTAVTLPQRSRGSYWTLLSFALAVAMPTGAAAWYYSQFAADQYVSEFRFAVTETSSGSPGGPSAGGLPSLLGSIGGASSIQTQNYIVTDYLTSRQVVEEMEAKIGLSQRYSRADIDWLSKFDSSQPTEKLVQYWQGMMTARYDPITGIATAEVRAFSPEDARLIAATLVTLSEELVNRIAMRAKNDTVRFAEAEARRAEDRLKAARLALTEYRIRENVIDPTAGLVSGNIAQVATVRASLIQLQTELATVSKQQVSAGSPVERALRSRINATREQLTSLEREVANERGAGPALANVVGRFEQLQLEREYAQNMLVSTMQALDSARASAGTQLLYLTPFVRPALPDSSTYPRRWRSVMMFALACGGAWLLMLLVYRSIRDAG